MEENKQIEIIVKFSIDEKESEISIKNANPVIEAYLFPAIIRVIRHTREKLKVPLY